MGKKKKNLELINTRGERLSNNYYTFQDVKEEIKSCKATCKKGSKPLKTSIIWAIIIIVINMILILRGVVSGRSGLLLLPFIPFELYYIFVIVQSPDVNIFGRAFLINIPVIIASIIIGNAFFPKDKMFIVVLGLTIYKTLILGINCSLDLKTTISDLKHYESILEDLNNKRGNLSYEEYDKQIFDKIAEYNKTVTGKNLYNQALNCNNSERLDLIKESAEYGNVNAQKVLEKYDEFLKLVNAEVVDYHNLLNFSNDEILKSITEAYLKHCEVKDSCDKDSLVKLKELGNENADRIIKNLAYIEYKQYKAEGTEDLKVLKKIADLGSYDACAEYAMQKYKEIINEEYITKSERAEIINGLSPYFDTGKSAYNKLIGKCCKIMQVVIKYQYKKGLYTLQEYKNDLSLLRKINITDDFKDVFGLDMDNALKECMLQLLQEIDNMEQTEQSPKYSQENSTNSTRKTTSIKKSLNDAYRALGLPVEEEKTNAGDSDFQKYLDYLSSTSGDYHTGI